MGKTLTDMEKLSDGGGRYQGKQFSKSKHKQNRNNIERSLKRRAMDAKQET